MAGTAVFVAALLLLWLFMSNRATVALHCRAIVVHVHAEAEGIVIGHGAMPALEYRGICIDVQAKAAGVVLGHGVMPTLECWAIEVHPEAAETSDLISAATSLDGSAANFHFEEKKLGYRPSDSELDEVKRSGYGDVTGSHSSLAESPAQLLLEEAQVKQLAGKKSWTPVVHQLQVPTKVSADGRKGIIPMAAGFPCNQENISNPSQNQVVDFSSLDQRVRPGVRSSYSTAGSVKVFRNEPLDSFVASPDDTPAQDAGTVKVISAMFSVLLLWISVVGSKWKTPRKVPIVLTALLLASITHNVESVDLQPPHPTVVVVQFDIQIFEPTFIQARDVLVVKPNCPVVDGHYIMPMEEYVKGGPVQPPPRWIRIDSTGETGKESSAIMRGDTNSFLSFVDGTGLVHFMGAENIPLFPGAHRLPFNESYPSLFDIEGVENADIVAFLQTIPLGKSHTEAANTILSDYTSATPARDVRGAILTYTITLGESQRIKSLGDRLRKNWDKTTFLTRDEAKDILVWDQLCYKWCDQKLGSPTDNLNTQLAERGLFSIDAINNTIDLVKWPGEKIGRCE